MKFEGEEVSERRYPCCLLVQIFFLLLLEETKDLLTRYLSNHRFSGTIIGVGDSMASGWTNSEWRSLKVSILLSKSFWFVVHSKIQLQFQRSYELDNDLYDAFLEVMSWTFWEAGQWHIQQPISSYLYCIESFLSCELWCQCFLNMALSLKS